MQRFKVNEIFYSLQGEGFHTGRPAVFVRFSGCNLRCPFCDTQHTDGTLMTTAEIVENVRKAPARFVVLTGGEPSLFVTEELIAALHAVGARIAIETNGTQPLPAGIDWVTLSPKCAFVPDAVPVLTRCDELKVVFDGGPVPTFENIAASHRFLQPCDVGDAERNAEIIRGAVDFCLHHPEWRLSLQTHKFLNIR